jgi:hypothetical protein
MEYTMTNEKTKYYKTNINKIIKIQSFVRMLYWFKDYTNKIKTIIDELFKKEKKNICA